MKFTKNICAVATAILTLVVIAGCSQPAPDFVGTWVTDTSQGTIVLEMTANGKYSITSSDPRITGMPSNATWTLVEPQTIHVTQPATQETQAIDISFHYEIQGMFLTLTYLNDDGSISDQSLVFQSTKPWTDKAATEKAEKADAQNADRNASIQDTPERNPGFGFRNMPWSYYDGQVWSTMSSVDQKLMVAKLVEDFVLVDMDFGENEDMILEMLHATYSGKGKYGTYDSNPVRIMEEGFRIMDARAINTLLGENP